MPRPTNVKKLIAKIMKLDENAKAQIREALKEAPRIAKLKAERERIEAEIAKLESGATPAKRRGRKPGRPAKVADAPAKRRGRPAKAVSSPAKASKAPGKRGRKAVSTPATRAAAVKPAKVKKPMTPEARQAMLDRMAKARAARGKAK